MGFKAWYDNRADDLTKEGMLKGIERAAAFILFLSSGVLQRPYCQLEIRHAVALKKPIILLHGELSEVRAHWERAAIGLPGRLHWPALVLSLVVGGDREYPEIGLSGISSLVSYPAARFNQISVCSEKCR